MLCCCHRCLYKPVTWYWLGWRESPLAQSVEHWSHKPKDPSSNPGGCNKIFHNCVCICDTVMYWNYHGLISEALKESLGLILVGPYDILSGRHKGVTKNKRGKRPNFLLHYRFYYDPPEFTTVIMGDRSKQYHLGYFRWPCRISFNLLSSKMELIGWSNLSLLVEYLFLVRRNINVWRTIGIVPVPEQLLML